MENHGHEGVPATIVYSLLLKALATCEVINDSPKKEQEEDAKVDCNYSAEGININLTLNMCSLWFPAYTFALKQKDVGEIEIIKSQLKDAFEKIQTLENNNNSEREPAVLSLSSAVAHSYQAIVQWNAPSRITNPDYFTISPDFSTVSILKRGLYQVCVRLAGTNGINGSSPIILLLDGNILASCVQSDANSHQNSAHINQIFEFKTGAVLSVKSCFSHKSLANPAQNTFDISLLQAM